MKKEVRYCPMCKKSETREECLYGPKVWDKLAMNEQVINEARKRDHIANAILGLSFATNVLQSPSAFISSGGDEGSGMQLMSRMMKRRAEADRNLDSGRVSHPARNRIKEELKKEVRIESFKDWWNKGRNERVPDEDNASWRKLMADDMSQITRTDSAFRSGSTGIKGWRPHKAFSPKMIRTGPTPAVRQAVERPIRTVKKFIRTKLKEELNIDKKTLMMMLIKKLIDEKKRKNYLLNYGYIGEQKLQLGLEMKVKI